MKSKISVIIPVKNRASLLPHTLENIIQQSLYPYEIIVVDDNSTDNISSVVDKFKDRVIFLKNKGSGAGAARNTGFEISSGNYIQFFDSDDLMTKNKLEVQSKILSETGSGMVYCPHFKAAETEPNQWLQLSPILYYKPFSPSLRYDQWLIRGACMITQACLFDKNIFKEAGLWRTDLMPHDDLEFLFRIGKVVPYPKHSNNVAVLYRQHGNQITDKMVDDTAKILDQIKAWLIIRNGMKSNYSKLDFINLERNIFHNYNLLKDKSLIDIEISFNFKHKLLDYYYRSIFKSERLRTRSEWRILHGISNSKHVFQGYIKSII
jgi:glycosyltransferase involved in cell wall biosynthesis